MQAKTFFSNFEHCSPTVMPRGRAGYAKSTNGCSTCKIRKVKCDETYPECDRCVQTGRRCDGPVPRFNNFTVITNSQQDARVKEEDSVFPSLLSPYPAANSRAFLKTPLEAHQPPLQSLSLPLLPDQPYEERRAFSFFINVAAPQISGMHDVFLWGQLVPQSAHYSKAVWNAVISIAQLWEYPLKDSKRLELNPNNLSNHQIQALKWYDRAICMQKAAHGKSNDLMPVLTCTLFASIELQKSNYVNGFTMIRLGFAMMVPFLVCDDRMHCDPLKSSLIHQYMRSACLMLSSKLETEFNPSAFSDLTSARAVLIYLMYSIYGLIKEMFYTIKDQTFSAAHIVHRESILTRAVLQVRLRLRQIVELNGRQVDSTADLRYLRDYLDALSLWLDNIRGTNPSSTTEDQFLSRIIDKAQRIITYRDAEGSLKRDCTTFFTDIVLLPPLYFTATMSDNSNIRHQALDLMSRYTSQIHPEQLHGIVAIDDPTSPDGHSVLLQRFHNCWDERGKRTRVDTYTKIVVKV